MTMIRRRFLTAVLTATISLGAIAFADTTCPNPNCPNPEQCTGQCPRNGSGHCPNEGQCPRDGSGQCPNGGEGNGGGQRRGNPNRGTNGN